MCNQEHLVGFLYDDLAPADRAAFQAHLSVCAACRQELAELGGVRQLLTAWSPPEPQLEFQIVGGPRHAGGRSSLPAWGLAAAATILLLAGASALANLEIRYGPDGLVVRTGWGGAEDTPAEAAVQAGSRDVTPEPALQDVATERMRAQLLALERRLAELEQTQADAAGARPAAAFTPEQLSIVRRMVADSEQRQQAERAQLVTQVWNDFSAARASDYVRMHEALGRVQGLTNYQLKQHKESIDSLYRVSLQR